MSRTSVSFSVKSSEPSRCPKDSALNFDIGEGDGEFSKLRLENLHFLSGVCGDDGGATSILDRHLVLSELLLFSELGKSVSMCGIVSKFLFLRVL